MVGVDLADGGHEPVVDRADDLAARVAGLVEQVVTRHGRVVAVALGERLPQVHDAVLEVRVLPERGDVGRVVGVPVLVLAAGHGVQVDHAVDAGLRARADRTVEALEAVAKQLERRVVALEVALVDRDPDAVDPEPGEQRRVLAGEEAVEQPGEEVLGPLRAEHAPDRRPHRASFAG